MLNSSNSAFLLINLILFIIFTPLLHTSEIPLHLIINNPQGALKIIDENIASGKQDKQLMKWKIQCASMLCAEELLLSTYKQFIDTYPDSAYNDDVLENVAWGIINKTALSSSPIIRTEGAVAALISNDAKGIPLFKNTLRDPNVTVRLIACELAAHLKDEVIEQVITHAAFNDPSQEVQQQAIGVLGAMQAKATQKLLRELLEDTVVPIERKKAALGALIQILPSINETFLEPLVKSTYPFLRILACNLVSDRYLTKELPIIIPLLNDSNQDVRISALEAVGVVATPTLLQEKSVYDTIKELAQHPDSRQNIRANWILLLRGDKSDIHDAQKRLLKWTENLRGDAHLLAASALAHAGRRGVEPMAAALKKCTDPYLAITLSIGLIYQRQHISLAASSIEQALQKIEDRIARQQSGIFSWIDKTTIRHHGIQARLPETQDFLVRLELYSILATCGTQDLSHKLKKFFQESSWGVSGSAATLLLQEGDPNASEILQTLLDDQASDISLQAACILALYTQDAKALQMLEKHWTKATRQQKEFILYAMGQIGSKNSLPFLTQVLDEPFQTLRIRAAAAILQCLWK